MGARDADIRRRIFERRAAFLTASLATLAGCGGPRPLTPLPTLDAPAEDDAGPPDGSASSSLRPIEPKDTPAHQARNRRVEVRKMEDGERCEGNGK